MLEVHAKHDGEQLCAWEVEYGNKTQNQSRILCTKLCFGKDFSVFVSDNLLDTSCLSAVTGRRLNTTATTRFTYVLHSFFFFSFLFASFFFESLWTYN